MSTSQELYREDGDISLVVERTGRGIIRCRSWPDGGGVSIHRLAVVAWFGWDAVVDRDVHHRIPVPWLNVEPNLLPLPKPEHGKLTAAYQQDGLSDSVLEGVTSDLGGGYDE